MKGYHGDFDVTNGNKTKALGVGTVNKPNFFLKRTCVQILIHRRAVGAICGGKLSSITPINKLKKFQVMFGGLNANGMDKRSCKEVVTAVFINVFSRLSVFTSAPK